MYLMRTRIVLLIVFFCIAELYSQSSFNGTIISYARTRDSVVIAVDSKFTVTHSNHAPESTFIKSKIRCFGNTGFIIGGLSREDPGFDAYSIAESICVHTPDIRERARLFDEIVSPLLEQIWRRTLALGDTIYLYEKNVSIVFFGFFNDTSFVCIKMLVPKKQNTQPLPKLDKGSFSYPSTSSDTPFNIGVVPKQIADFDKQLFTRGILSYSTWVERVRGIVALGIEMFPDRNGYPIETVCVTRTNVEWIR